MSSFRGPPQMAVKLVLEPLFEADFLPCSSAVTPKPAIRGHFKTGHRSSGRTTVVIIQPDPSEQDISSRAPAGRKRSVRKIARRDVARGSEAVIDWVPSAHKYALDHRNALVARGVLVRNQDRYVFTQDYTFDSPSGAAQVIQGRSANGRIDWKNDCGTTLKEIQERAAPSETPE